MSLVELKQEVAALTSEERLQLAAFLADLDRDNETTASETLAPLLLSQYQK